MNGLWPPGCFHIHYGIFSSRCCRFHPDDHKVGGRVSLIARALPALSSSFVPAWQMLPKSSGADLG